MDLRAYECTCVQYNQWDEPVGSSRTEVNHPDDCQPGNSLEECEYRPLYDVTVIRKASDGVVTVESQAGYPGAVRDEMRGSNHQQMVNDSNTKRMRDNLMDGEYGTYFFTPIR